MRLFQVIVKVIGGLLLCALGSLYAFGLVVNNSFDTADASRLYGVIGIMSGMLLIAIGSITINQQ